MTASPRSQREKKPLSFLSSISGRYGNSSSGPTKANYCQFVTLTVWNVRGAFSRLQKIKTRQNYTRLLTAGGIFGELKLFTFCGTIALWFSRISLLICCAHKRFSSTDLAWTNIHCEDTLCSNRYSKCWCHISPEMEHSWVVETRHYAFREPPELSFTWTVWGCLGCLKWMTLKRRGSLALSSSMRVEHCTHN